MISVEELAFLCEAHAGPNWDLSMTGRSGRLSLVLTPVERAREILAAPTTEDLAAKLVAKIQGRAPMSPKRR